MKMVVGVLFGGRSVEHDISIISAIQVMKVIDKNKYQVVPLYLTKDNILLTSEKYMHLATYKKPLKSKKEEYVNLIRKEDGSYLSFTHKKLKKALKIDLILPIMHGKGVEDGNISGYLETLNIPNPTSKVLGACVAQDKEFTKIILESMNINIVPYEVYTKDQYEHSLFEYPIIVKPAKLGSSIGITKVHNDEEYEKAIHRAFKFDNKLIVEKCLVDFRELSIAGYFRKGEVVLSDIEEIKLSSDIYRFADKYQNGNKQEANNHIIPANISKELEKKIRERAEKIYKKLELFGVVRFDFLYDNQKDILYVNEINTIPGSLAFYLFESQGITFQQLIDDLIKQTLITEELNKEYLASFKSSILENNTLNSKK